MQEHAGGAEGIRWQIRAPKRRVHTMLTGHRKSYVKTILAAGSVSLVSLILAVMWVAKSEIAVLGFAVSRAEHPMVFWTCVCLLVIVWISGATVAAGGAICLARELKQLG